MRPPVAQIDVTDNSLLRDLLTYMMEDSRKMGLRRICLFGAKNLKRFGDHPTKIAETVYYLVRGEALDDDRPGDDTSLPQVGGND